MRQKATIDFVKNINRLEAEKREHKTWHYLLIGETQFYSLKKSGADIVDLAKSTEINGKVLSGNLFD